MRGWTRRADALAHDDNDLDDFNPDEFEDFQNEGLRYGDVPELGGMEIPAALQGLTLLRDPYLSMGAFNLAIVDGFLNGLEEHVLGHLFDEDRTPIDDAMVLNAQSQMWIFAAYEVMRTWQQCLQDAELGALVQSFVLMRNAPIKMVDEGAMPTQADLERRLFCGHTE